MSEAQVKRSIIEHLLYQRCLVMIINSGAATPERADGKRGFIPFNRWQVLGSDEEIAGVSDLFALTPAGVWLVIETKDIGKRDETTPAQRRFLAECAARGAVCVVAECVEDVMDVLEGVGV